MHNMLKESVKDYDVNSDDALLRDLLLDELTVNAAGNTNSSTSNVDDASTFAASMMKSIESIGWIICNCDKESTNPTSAHDEFDRLMTMRAYSSMDWNNDTMLTRMTQMASSILSYEFCWILLMDLRVSWILSSHGIERMDKTPRNLHMPCAHALNTKYPVMIVEDLSKDDRFQTACAFLNEPMSCRFYAAAPIVAPDGCRLGVFGVADRKPSTMSEKEQNILREFADLTMQHLIERRRKVDLETKLQKAVACTSHEIMTPLMGLQLSLATLKEDASSFYLLSDEQRDVLSTAESCVSTICHLGSSAMQGVHESLRASKFERQRSLVSGLSASTCLIFDLVARLHQALDSIEKAAPLIITIDKKTVESEMVCDAAIFRAALAILCLACVRTLSGVIQLDIRVENGCLVFNFRSSMPPPQEHETSKFPNPEKESASPCIRQASNLIESLGGVFGQRSSDEEPTTFIYFRMPILPSRTTSIITTDFKQMVPAEKGNMDALNDVSPHSDVSTSSSTSSNSLYSDEGAVSQVNDKNGSRKKKALVVDDSLVVRKSLKRALSRKFGFEVILAKDGEEGLARLQETLFDFVLMDFLMPVMDGLDCVNQYRHWEARNRPWFRQLIIGMSAHAGENDIHHGLQLGMDDFKNKPVTMETLEEINMSIRTIQVRRQLDYLLPLAHFADDTDQRCKKRKGPTHESFSALHSHAGSKLEKLLPGSIKVGFRCLVCCSSASLSNWTSQWNKGAHKPIGWTFELVSNSDEALARLKEKNYDAVIVEPILVPECGIPLVSRFRRWEALNRVNRQRNVLLHCPAKSFSQSVMECASMYVQPPSGFDGVIGSEKVRDVLAYLVGAAADLSRLHATSLVSR